MGKVKIKKKDVWIDMTPMSDVMVLLLTFFMLTSTFVKNEPVKVVTPGSVSEIKVPEKNVLTILVSNEGKVFMEMDNQNDLEMVLNGMADKFGITLNGKQVKKFKKAPTFGVPMDKMSQLLSLPEDQQDDFLKASTGIPTDSIKGGMSEFQAWVNEARNDNPDIKIAIKSDSKTQYKVVKKVMGELQNMNENRYYLITSYKKQED